MLLMSQPGVGERKNTWASRRADVGEQSDCGCQYAGDRVICSVSVAEGRGMFVTFLERGKKIVFAFQALVLTFAIVRAIILNELDWLAIPMLAGIWGFAWLMIKAAGFAARAMRRPLGRPRS